MGQLNADGDGVFILELEGSGSFFQLVESDTPRKGVVEAGKVRMVTTRYPGTSRPSTQIMGTEDEVIPFEGTFRDDLYGLDGHAMAQRTALRALMLGQNLCELNWGSALVKRGYVERVECTLHAEGWVDYRFDFHVVESDEAVVVATPFPPPETTFDLLALLREIQDAVEEVAEATVLLNNVAYAVT
jgi:hypothetical protein